MYAGQVIQKIYRDTRERDSKQPRSKSKYAWQFSGVGNSEVSAKGRTSPDRGHAPLDLVSPRSRRHWQICRGLCRSRPWSNGTSLCRIHLSIRARMDERSTGNTRLDFLCILLMQMSKAANKCSCTETTLSPTWKRTTRSSCRMKRSCAGLSESNRRAREDEVMARRSRETACEFDCLIPALLC